MLRTATKHFIRTSSTNSYFRSIYQHGLSATSWTRVMPTAGSVQSEVRQRLTSELRTAMKSKDTFASTVLRSVLAEVYSADKNPSGPVSSSHITSIVKKAIARRKQSAQQFTTASRVDLAEVEVREAKYLETFLPPELSETEIDSILREIAVEKKLTTAGTDIKRGVSILLQSFFGKVDRARVDGKLVKERAQLMLDSYHHT